ncbi:MAG: hypothetical protein DDG60_13660 [Anaerolineae bacterium]|nr:MAG: hypothetical protein DDG60_13660 [Anaerolineae bacterium]
MNKSLFFLSIVLILSLACNFLAGIAPNGQPANATSTPLSTTSDGFYAEVVDGGVTLKWDAVSGAEQYWVELQVGDDFIPLAVLPADQLTYLDSVFDGAQYTYRLTIVGDSVRTKPKTVKVLVPEEQSDPQSVTLAFDMAPPAIDLNNLDWSQIDPKSLESGNFYSSMFAPTFIQSEAKIGPEGGELSVTGANGVTYTLTVPPGALAFQTTIRLKPISTIPDLPLSGGVLGAVFIEPQEIVFDLPATLKMFPPSDFSPPADLLQVGFGFEDDGQEFHLYPLDPESFRSSKDTLVASLSMVPLPAPPLSDIAKLQYGGGYGVGSGTVSDVKKVKMPAKAANRAAQRAARAQMDELAPLTSIEPLAPLPNLPPEAARFQKIGEAIRQKVDKANDWNSLMDVLDEFRMYLDLGGDKFNKRLNAEILDQLVDKIKAFLEKARKDCLSVEEMKVQELIRRLGNPKRGNFDQALTERFKEKFGENLLNNLLSGSKDCVFTLDGYSNLTFEVEQSIMFVTMKVQGLVLYVGYHKGDVFLHGDKQMTLEVSISGHGCNFPVKQYTNLDLVVSRLTPIYVAGVLRDFTLQMSVNGWVAQQGGAFIGQGDCPIAYHLDGGGDFWTALFTISRMAHADYSISGWKITGGPLIKGVPLTAKWEAVDPTFSPREGVVMSETSHFTLKGTPSR